MADQNSACIEENPDCSPNESQRQIPFDAGKNLGWPESTTPEESRTSEVNPPATWGGLVSSVDYDLFFESKWVAGVTTARAEPSRGSKAIYLPRSILPATANTIFCDSVTRL